MSIVDRLKWMTTGVAILALCSMAVAQETNGRVLIGSGGSQAGGQATVDWGYENLQDEISSYSFIIEFDQTMLEPVVTGDNRDVVGCLENIPADWSGVGTTCRNEADSGEIIVVIAEQSGNPFGDFKIFPTTLPVGSIAFTIDSTATTGTILPLEGVLTTATGPSLEDVSDDSEIIDGQIEVLDVTAIVNIESGGGPAGGQVTVDWNYENFRDEVSSYSYIIEFDQTMLEPLVTGGNRNVVGCLDNIPADWSGVGTTCRNDADSGEIVVVIAEQSGNPFGDFKIFPTTQPVGSITFTIDPTATIGTTFPLEGVVTTATGPSLEDVSDDFKVFDGQIAALDVTAILNVQPDTLNFGSQETGSTSGAQSVTVSNDGGDNVDLEITGINVTGEFDNAGGTCVVGTTLADNETCTIDVTFSPATDGVKSGQLQVTSDAGEVANHTVELNGEGFSIVVFQDRFEDGS